MKNEIKQTIAAIISGFGRSFNEPSGSSLTKSPDAINSYLWGKVDNITIIIMLLLTPGPFAILHILSLFS